MGTIILKLVGLQGEGNRMGELRSYSISWSFVDAALFVLDAFCVVIFRSNGNEMGN